MVITSLPDDGVLESVAGPDGIIAGLAEGTIWIDMSTISPRASRAVAERVRTAGAAMLDAPVSGSVPQVQAGTLTIMVGGDEDACARVEPILRELGTPTHIGIDPKRAIDVMTQSPIGSPMLKARADLVLNLPDDAWFDVSLMQKDIALALDAARQVRVPLPSAAAADEVLTFARASGSEHRDLAALYQVLARLTTDRA